MRDLTRARISRALDGDGAQIRELVDLLTPVIQARVVRALVRRGEMSRGRNVRQEVEDMTQEVFMALFEDGGRALRAWDPDRGLSLPGFVSFLAERQIITILRTARRSPWTEDPTLNEALDEAPDTGPDLEAAVEQRQLWGVLLDRMEEVLSPLGRALFQRLLVDQRPVAEICEELGMTRDAVYAWQSRLGKLMRRLAREVMSDASAPPRTARAGGLP